MRLVKRALLLFTTILIFVSSPCLSQDYAFKRRSIGVEDGLTSRNINLFFFDSEGLVWMGTEFGLNRYDGYQVETFTKSKQQLIINEVGEISEDFRGNLWLRGKDPQQGNIDVTQVFVRTSQKALKLNQYIEGEIPFTQTDIHILRSDEETCLLWILLKDGSVYTFGADEYNQGKFVKQYEIGEMPYRSKAGPKGLWIQTPTRLLLVGAEGQLKESYDDTNQNILTLLGTDLQGNIITMRKSMELAETREIGHSIFLNNQPLYGENTKFWNDKRMVGFDVYGHRGWYGHQGFRKVYDAKNQELIRFELKSEFYAFPKFVTFDKAGNGWSNHDGRVHIVTIEQSRFTNYLTNQSVFGVNGYGTRGIYVNEHNELFTNGLGPSKKVDLNTKEVTNLIARSGFYYGRGDQEELKRLAMIPDNKGNLWLTDESRRLIKFNPKKNSYKDYTYSPSLKIPQTPDGRNRDILVHWSGLFDAKGRLWMGGRNGLRFLHPKDSVLMPFEGYGAFPELENSSVFHFFQNRQGIWISAETGLYLMNDEHQIVKRYHSTGDKDNFIPFNSIAHTREDSQGWFWLATRGGGLIKLNPKNGEFTQYTAKDGLSDDVVYASYEDDYGHMWVSSNRGIMRIRLADFNINTYLKADGLNHEEFNTTSHFKAKDGRIFFGSIDGITAFHPKDFVEEVVTERNLKVMQLQKQSRKTGLYEDQTPDFLQKNEIRINPSELGFSVGFTLFDYINAPSNIFSYKVEGIDRQWNYIDQPLVRINALPYGNYELIIRGQSSQGIWSREVSIPIYVLKPFYLQWWFFISIALMLGLMVYYYIKTRIKRLETAKATLEKEVKARTETISAQANELKKMDKLKSRFFANVSHELRTPLTLILGPVASMLEKEEQGTEKRQELKRVLRNGQSMSNLVEEILDLSKLDAKELEVTPRITSAREYFEVIFTNFLSQAQYKDIDYQYDYEGDEELTVMLDQRLVNRIVSNLLSNAFKYTDRGETIALQVDATQQQLAIKVTDSGMGISDNDLPHIFERYFQTKDTDKPVQGGSGIGLAISKELSILMEGDLSVESEQNEGSTFTLFLPKVIYQGEFKTGPATENTEEYAEQELKNEEAFGHTKLLLVEDNADMRDFVRSQLHDFDSIAEAANGIEALNQLKQGLHPDLIISDLMMPEMDGMTFLKKLRSRTETKDIPLLMLTARSAEEDKLEAFSLGVDDYLLKPFSVQELKARLKNLLRNARVRSEAQNEVVQIEQDDEITNSKIPVDHDLLKSIERLTREGVHKIDFNITAVANEVGLSERQLQRKLKTLTGLTPVVFVKEVRLQMARNYLEQKTYLQVKDVAKAVGFSSTPYFSKMYKDRFGKLPGSYFAEASTH